MQPPTHVTRRRVLGGAAAGLSLPVLAACSTDGGDDSSSRQTGTPEPSEPTGTGSPDTQSPDTDSGAPSDDAADALVATSEVPVGSGVILDDVVVTQPSEGEFKAFSATCTHQGCKVSSVDTAIHCVCHDSQFSITDGSVEAGPATAPLPEESISVAGDSIVQG